MREETIALDPERAARALEEAAPPVFADMAFLDVEPTAVSWGPRSEEVPDRLGGGASRIAIDMLKPLSCRMELEFPQELADRVNENLYGGEDAPVGMTGDDSTLELINVLAGAFLSGYFGPGAAFRLELPFFVYGEQETSGPLIARVDLDAEGLPAVLTLRSIRYRY